MSERDCHEWREFDRYWDLADDPGVKLVSGHCPTCYMELSGDGTSGPCHRWVPPPDDDCDGWWEPIIDTGNFCCWCGTRLHDDGTTTPMSPVVASEAMAGVVVWLQRATKRGVEQRLQAVGGGSFSCPWHDGYGCQCGDKYETCPNGLHPHIEDGGAEQAFKCWLAAATAACPVAAPEAGPVAEAVRGTRTYIALAAIANGWEVVSYTDAWEAAQYLRGTDLIETKVEPLTDGGDDVLWARLSDQGRTILAALRGEKGGA